MPNLITERVLQPYVKSFINAGLAHSGTQKPSKMLKSRFSPGAPHNDISW